LDRVQKPIAFVAKRDREGNRTMHPRTDLVKNGRLGDATLLWGLSSVEMWLDDLGHNFLSDKGRDSFRNLSFAYILANWRLGLFENISFKRSGAKLEVLPRWPFVGFLGLSAHQYKAKGGLFSKELEPL
jgi:hypothetical protein